MGKYQCLIVNCLYQCFINWLSNFQSLLVHYIFTSLGFVAKETTTIMFTIIFLIVVVCLIINCDHGDNFSLFLQHDNLRTLDNNRQYHRVIPDNFLCFLFSDSSQCFPFDSEGNCYFFYYLALIVSNY